MFYLLNDITVYVTIKTFNTCNILKFKFFYYGDMFRYKVPSSGYLYVMPTRIESGIELILKLLH
jgi:hypothetical protein